MVFARHQGGPEGWNPIARLDRFRTSEVEVSGDTRFAGDVRTNTPIQVYASDVDRDGLRDGIDPCPRDPLNNSEGRCQRAGWAYPSLDDLISLSEFSTWSPQPRLTILTVTYTNSSGTVIRN